MHYFYYSSVHDEHVQLAEDLFYVSVIITYQIKLYSFSNLFYWKFCTYNFIENKFWTEQELCVKHHIPGGGSQGQGLKVVNVDNIYNMWEFEPREKYITYEHLIFYRTELKGKVNVCRCTGKHTQSNMPLSLFHRKEYTNPSCVYT